MSDISLTKTKIKSGLQCHKKLWYDLNDPIIEKNFIFSIGNRFGEHIKSHYGEGLDLTGQFGSDVEYLTRNAMLDPNVKVIYEAAFIFSQTQVRADALIRNGKKWELIEIKSSISLKDEHIKDAAIQVYVITNSNVFLSDVRIAHINKNFCYAGNDEYRNLILEIDINENVKKFLPSVQGWINDLLPITDKKLGVPIKQMGDQCSKPHKCPYIKRCESQTYLADVEIPISILPNVGSSLQKEWGKKNIYDLRDLPEEALKKDSHRKIQLCHKKNIELINPELRDQIKRYEWPRYFIDFETEYIENKRWSAGMHLLEPLTVLANELNQINVSIPHGDIVKKNVLWDGSNFVLVDWEPLLEYGAEPTIFFKSTKPYISRSDIKNSKITSNTDKIAFFYFCRKQLYGWFPTEPNEPLQLESTLTSQEFNELVFLALKTDLRLKTDPI